MRVALLPLGLLPFAAAQVRVTVPLQQYNLNDRIRAKIENVGSEPVTFCLEMGQTSSDGVITESTPIPFIVQQSSEGTWRPFFIGPDAGKSWHRAFVLDPGNSHEFPFRLDHPGLRPGRMRLLLFYWSGSQPELDCAKPPKGARKTESAPFLMRLMMEE
jgi:hypothetical protein